MKTLPLSSSDIARYIVLVVFASALSNPKTTRAQEFDLTTHGTWTGEVRIVADTAKGFIGDSSNVRRSNFPFPNCTSLPSEILSITEKRDHAILKVRVYSTRENEDYHELGAISAVNDDKGWRLSDGAKPEDSVEITVKVPRLMGHRLGNLTEGRVVSVGGRVFWEGGDYGEWEPAFVFTKDTRELIAIYIGSTYFNDGSGEKNDARIIPSGRAFTPARRPENPPDRWDEEPGETLGKLFCDSINSPTRKGPVWAQPTLPANKSVYIEHGGSAIQFPVSVSNDVWYYSEDGTFYGQFGRYLPAFFVWYTQGGITVYATKKEGAAGADGANLTTITSSVSASEFFGERRAQGSRQEPTGMQILGSAKEVNAPRGFVVLDEPKQSANVIKEVNESTSVNVRAYQDVGGTRYWISDWSFDRIAEGHAPNYIRLR